VNGAEALARFQEARMRHPRLGAVELDLLGAIAQPAGADILLLAGPTGVGKTTLRDGLVKRLGARLLQSHPEARHPLLSFDTPEGTRTGFSMKSFYFAALEALREPDLDAKIDLAPAGLDDAIAQRHDAPEWVLRRQLRRATTNLGVQVLIADEAQHMCLADGPHTREAILDALKTLHVATGALVVLLGTYDLLRFVNLNGQLARRVRPIHFPRYAPSEEDGDAWLNVVRWFQSRIGVEAPNLAERAEALYVGSAGCVGVLKLWLERALDRMARDGRDRLLVADLDATRYSSAALTQMATEIKAGEKAFQDDPTGEAELRRLLGLDAPAASPVMTRPREESRRRPFERTLQRDPVGVRIRAAEP
jgi:hypothetical protein